MAYRPMVIVVLIVAVEPGHSAGFHRLFETDVLRADGASPEIGAAAGALFRANLGKGTGLNIIETSS